MTRHERLYGVTSAAKHRSASGKLHLSTHRGLYESDVADFIRLVHANPRKRVRVYSSDGFVPGSYFGRCQIQFLQRNDGKLWVGWTGAQRNRGQGNLQVVK